MASAFATSPMPLPAATRAPSSEQLDALRQMNDEQLATREAALRALLHGWELRNTQLLGAPPTQQQRASDTSYLEIFLALKQLELVAHERGAQREGLSWAAVEAEPEAVFATAPDGTTEQVFNADGSPMQLRAARGTPEQIQR